MLRLAGEAVVGEGVAGEVHPATHGEAAAHGDQEDVRDADGVVCHTCSSGKLQHITFCSPLAIKIPYNSGEQEQK